jgi:hypothetical protein
MAYLPRFEPSVAKWQMTRTFGWSSPASTSWCSTRLLRSGLGRTTPDAAILLWERLEIVIRALRRSLSRIPKFLARYNKTFMSGLCLSAYGGGPSARGETTHGARMGILNWAVAKLAGAPTVSEYCRDHAVEVLTKKITSNVIHSTF